MSVAFLDKGTFQGGVKFFKILKRGCSLRGGLTDLEFYFRGVLGKKG